MKRISYNLMIIITLLSSVLLLTACHSSKKDKKQPSATSVRKKESVKTNDTAKINQEKVKQKLLSATAPSLSPGSVAVSARVIMYDETAPKVVTILILGTHGYGSSTPALAKGTKLKVHISDALFNKYSAGAIKEEFSSSKPLSLILGFYQQVSVGGSPSHSWSVIDFKKN